EKAQAFLHMALIINITGMYVIELSTIVGLRTSNMESSMFYVFPFQFLNFYFFSKRNIFDKILLIVSILATAYSFYFDFQKSAFIYISSMLILTIWVSRKEIKLIRKILLIILFCVFLAFAYYFVWPIFVNEVFDRDYTGIISLDVNKLDSSLYRFYVYLYAFESLTSNFFHFLFGYGPGHFSKVHSGATPHSSLLYILISFGFFGFFSYYMLIFLSLFKSYKGLKVGNFPRLNSFFIVSIISGTIYSFLNNANGLAWEDASFATSILFFVIILLPFIIREDNDD
ncbi:hypothetical protein N9832_05185, partial [Amylibacter sp.]|nr:hypothetical protein [Amylibacter sp.]